MTASASDLLTTQKNNVVAINAVAGFLQVLYNNIPTAQLSQSAATTSVSTLYTANSKIAAHLNTINICNTAGAAASFSIFIVPSGGTAGPANAVFYNCAIAANTTTLWTGTLIIPAGGTLQASASATTVTFNIAGGASI